MASESRSHDIEATPLLSRPGAVEVTEAGKPSAHSHGLQLQRMLAYASALVPAALWWPISTLVFLIVFVLQIFAPKLYNALGNRWCYLPHQVNIFHAQWVIQHTIKETWFGWIFLFGWLVQPQFGVFITTSIYKAPPSYIYDEDENTAVVLSFDDYIAKKKDKFPSHSGQYRAIDGGGNNEKYPFLGQGGRGYGTTHPFQVLSVLPDPDALTQALCTRKVFRKAAHGQNALATWFANVAIHELFRSATGKDNKYVGGVDKPYVNLHSSYLDLQVLYGFNKETADAIRKWEGGHLFKIAEDRFDRSGLVESKLIIELLRREHNYVCDELSKHYPDVFDTDEKLYQQARLIMGACFISILQWQYGDQVIGSPMWTEHRVPYGMWCQQHGGRSGNHNSFGFNSVYRWHTAIPEHFTVKRKPPSIETDEDIKKVILDMIQTASGGHGRNNTPAELVDPPIRVEAAALRWAREVGCPRLNDYRKSFPSTPAFSSFEDLCGNDTELASILKSFYPTIDDVELPIGAQVDFCAVGGWALPITVTNTVIGDALNTIRQDRFYTDDYTPQRYTEWGYNFSKDLRLADVINRHLKMGLDRDQMLARLPDWKPVLWSDMVSSTSFDQFGNPILK